MKIHYDVPPMKGHFYLAAKLYINIYINIYIHVYLV